MGGCAVTHQNCLGGGAPCGTAPNGIGQKYWVSTDYCAAVGTPGMDSTYTEGMAAAAAAAAPQPTGCTKPPCVRVGTCTANATRQDAYFDDLTASGGPCIVWAFKTTGNGAAKAPSGHVHVGKTKCTCPTAADPKWD
jgi:hypothetical protein